MRIMLSYGASSRTSCNLDHEVWRKPRERPPSPPPETLRKPKKKLPSLCKHCRRLIPTNSVCNICDEPVKTDSHTYGMLSTMCLTDGFQMMQNNLGGFLSNENPARNPPRSIIFRRVEMLVNERGLGLRTQLSRRGEKGEHGGGKPESQMGPILCLFGLMSEYTGCACLALSAAINPPDMTAFPNPLEWDLRRRSARDRTGICARKP